MPARLWRDATRNDISKKRVHIGLSDFGEVCLFKIGWGKMLLPAGAKAYVGELKI